MRDSIPLPGERARAPGPGRGPARGQAPRAGEGYRQAATRGAVGKLDPLTLTLSQREREPGDAGFGVYIHWPFCLSKCPYCDFNSHVRGTIDEARFCRALLRELETLSARAGPRSVASVFFGGGTPSLMAPETVGALLDAVAVHFGVAADVEVTLEANPTSVEAARFQGFRAAGVNRLSLGVQALSDEALRFLGRRHSAQEALGALTLAQETFPRVSFDLIYARPGQTEASWQAELSRALGLGTEHLSLYQLTFEPGTPFGALHARGQMPGLNDEAQAALYETTQALCAEAGIPAYEISNHARPGGECRHNLVYWRYGDYLGVGPGAHGRISGRATVAIRAPDAWLAQVERLGHGLAEDEALSRETRGEEYLLMALRLTEGACLSRYQALAGAGLDESRIGALVDEGMLARSGDRIAATAQGRLVLNRVIEALAA